MKIHPIISDKSFLTYLYMLIGYIKIYDNISKILIITAQMHNCQDQIFCMGQLEKFKEGTMYLNRGFPKAIKAMKEL